MINKLILISIQVKRIKIRIFKNNKFFENEKINQEQTSFKLF